tara:strand:- start:2855 stop:4327 length:1473 start_codon:yes stop_codon:yes gene_type:complete
MKCPYCNSEDMALHSKAQGRWACGSCRKTTRSPITKNKFEPIVITKKKLVITYAQNATPVFSAGMRSLRTYCKKNDAQLVVIPGRYKNPTSQWTEAQEDSEWWADEVKDELCGTRIDVAKSLVICGDVFIQPTAVSPMTGLTTLTGAKSCIFGHPQISVEATPTPQNSMAKLCMTSGVITKPNYTDSKAGVKGEFHHEYGATLIELRGKKFHTRQLCIDGSGKFYDLDKCYSGSKVTSGHKAEAFISGDFHAKFLDPKVMSAWWTGKNALIKLIKPKAQVFHDLLDGYFGSHHHRLNPFLTLKKHFNGDNDGQTEVTDLIDKFSKCLIDGKNYVVKSNHDEHVDRWLNETDWRKDPQNAEFYLDLALAKVKAIKAGKDFDSLEHLVQETRATFLRRSDTLFCKGHALNYHGDKGPNGARGSLAAFNKIGCRSVIGHSHTPGRKWGVMQVGLSAIYQLEYATGSPSSWMHTAAIIYANGKGTLINCIDGEY